MIQDQDHFLIGLCNPAIHQALVADFFKPYQQKLVTWPWQDSVDQWVNYILDLAQLPESMNAFLDPNLEGGGSLKIRVDGAVLEGVTFSEEQYRQLVTMLCNQRILYQSAQQQSYQRGFLRDDSGKLYLLTALETALGWQATIYFPRQQAHHVSNWPPQAKVAFQKMQKHPNGLIVCCHRSWSQSHQDTIFAVLSELLEDYKGTVRVGCITEELPIFQLFSPDEAITQLCIDGSAQAWSMASRALIAQDVDVILMRGRNETEVLTQAVLTALEDRLVIVDVSCFSVLDTLMSLLNDVSVSPHLVASVLIGVVGSYPALRRVCPNCVRQQAANEAQRQALAQNGYCGAEDYNWPHIQGCPSCYGMGYIPSQRLTVAEAIYVDAELAKICTLRPNREQLKPALVERGLKTYFDQALELAQQGATTLQEAIRVGLGRRAEL